MPNFTFKLDEKPTGLMRVTERRGAVIKLGGKQCGRIYYAQDSYRIMLYIKDDSNRGGFKAMTLKYTGRDVTSCKDFIKRSSALLQEKYQLHCFED